jgi:carboxyl-terminal processing protease
MTTRTEREEIIANIAKTVKEKFINPNNLNQDLDSWAADLSQSKNAIAGAETEELFVSEIRRQLRKLGASHTAFFHGGGHGVPAPHAIHATLRAFDTNRGHRWVLQDVVEDGIAFRAGLLPGDILLAQDDRELIPPKAPEFSLGGRHSLSVVGQNGAGEKQVKLTLPAKAAKDRPPMIEPKSVSHKVLDGDIGLLRIASFPGVSGKGFAARLDPAVRDLVKAGCTRLIVDLRGNVGGGLGSLRLMSYLTPAKIPVGYSLTRARLRSEFKKESLPRIGKIPSTRIAELAMAVRFGILQKDRSITLCTEGLRKQPFQGRVVIIINEHSHSAAEMVAAFVSENHLGKTIGTRTAGEVLGGANFRVGSEYRVRIPVAAWYTWAGRTIEGTGVAPDVPVDVQFDDLSRQKDRQLEAAIEFARRS